MARFPTTITRLSHPNISGLGGLLCWCLVVSGNVPFLIVGCTLHLPAGSVVMKGALVVLWEITDIRLNGCWCGRGVNCHNLLLLRGLLSWLDLLFVSKLSLVTTFFRLLKDGSHYALSNPMINEPLGKTFSAVEGRRVGSNYIP